MSWGLFKRNILRKTNPNTNPSLTVNEVATIWAEEYDAAVKRGKDFINFESIQRGNLDIMKTLKHTLFSYYCQIYLIVYFYLTFILEMKL